MCCRAFALVRVLGMSTESTDIAIPRVPTSPSGDGLHTAQLSGAVVAQANAGAAQQAPCPVPVV